MKENEQLPLLSRRSLDGAFHSLQDQITRITVEEEEEMTRMEADVKEKNE